MWFRPATISKIIERTTSVNTINTGVASFADRSQSISQATILQFLTLEEASGASLAGGSEAVEQRLRGVGGNIVTTAGGFTTHQFTSDGNQTFTIESF